MKKMLFVGGLVLIAASVFAQTFKLGNAVRDFTLNDLDGNPVQFSALTGDVTAVLFIATQCPISNDYNERMKAVYKDYHNRGVKFVFINSNSTEPAGDVRKHIASNGFPFQVYKDPNNVVADMFAAEFTPEVFVLDKEGSIRYHGFIDDHRAGTNIQVQGLRLALNALLGGQKVSLDRTKAFGCTIKRVKKAL